MPCQYNQHLKPFLSIQAVLKYVIALCPFALCRSTSLPFAAMTMFSGRSDADMADCQEMTNRVSGLYARGQVLNFPLVQWSSA